MRINITKILFLTAGLLLTNPVINAAENKPFTSTDGKVDIYTHVGWKVFNMNRYSCHGVDAVKTDIAPDLLESLKSMSKNQFITKVLTSYRITVGANRIIGEDRTALRDAIMTKVLKNERAEEGEIIMPAWSRSPYVEPHVEDLYAYLKARSDGAIAAGEPKVILP